MKGVFYKLELIGDVMIDGVFLKEKPVKTLVALVKKDRVWYASMLCKEIDCTYPHMINVLNTFESEGLIESEGQGRIKIITLTEKGEDLAHDFEGVIRRIQKYDEGG